jgi:hypothetical protein
VKKIIQKMIHMILKCNIIIVKKAFNAIIILYWKGKFLKSYILKLNIFNLFKIYLFK